jgi:hypothetical protein
MDLQEPRFGARNGGRTALRTLTEQEPEATYLSSPFSFYFWLIEAALCMSVKDEC